MAKQVKWSKKLYDEFCTHGMLNDFEIEVMRRHILGESRVKTALDMSVSLSTIDKTISILKQKYDIVHSEHPDIFPPRKKKSAYK